MPTNRLSNVTDWARRQTVFGYDLASHLKTITRPNGAMWLINYDDAGQVSTITEQTGSGGAIAFFGLHQNGNQWHDKESPIEKSTPVQLHVTHLPCRNGEEFSLIIPNVPRHQPSPLRLRRGRRATHIQSWLPSP